VLGQGNIGGGLLDIRSKEQHQKRLYRLTTTRLRKNNIDILGRTSKEARAMDSWRQSPVCTARHDPQEIGRSPFWAQRSRSQNRSLVTGGEGRKKVRKQPARSGPSY
jgi:hypothetical protein